MVRRFKTNQSDRDAEEEVQRLWRSGHGWCRLAGSSSYPGLEEEVRQKE